MINESLNRIEGYTYGFAREANALTSLVEHFSSGEREGVLKRAYIAKEFATSIQKEIDDKWKFLRKYKRLGKRGIMRF